MIISMFDTLIKLRLIKENDIYDSMLSTVFNFTKRQLSIDIVQSRSVNLLYLRLMIKK